MSFTITSPIVGPTTITGLTNPTYTAVEDGAPPDSSRQYIITTANGAQTGVTTHSVASPFTVTMYKPKSLKTLGSPNPVTGRIAVVPVNVYKVIVRKGVTILAGQPVATSFIRSEIHVPAGCETADQPNLRALVACHAGVMQVNANIILDSLTFATL